MTPQHSAIRLSFSAILATVALLCSCSSMHGTTTGFRYEGKVLKVNYDYNYAVCSHDARKHHVRPDLLLVIVRGKERIAHVQITKLYKNYLVGDILHSSREGEIVEGDRVIYDSTFGK